MYLQTIEASMPLLLKLADSNMTLQFDMRNNNIDNIDIISISGGMIDNDDDNDNYITPGYTTNDSNLIKQSTNTLVLNDQSLNKDIGLTMNGLDFDLVSDIIPNSMSVQSAQMIDSNNNNNNKEHKNNNSNTRHKVFKL